MSMLNLAQLAELTGYHRTTIKDKLSQMPYENGPRNSRLYDSSSALKKIYRGGAETLDLGQARAELAVVQKEKIEMDMDLKQGSFVAVDEAEELVSRVFSSFRARTLSIPSKAVPLLQVATTQVKQMEVLQELVRDALEELSVPEEFTPVPRLVE